MAAISLRRATIALPITFFYHKVKHSMFDSFVQIKYLQFHKALGFVRICTEGLMRSVAPAFSPLCPPPAPPSCTACCSTSLLSSCYSSTRTGNLAAAEAMQMVFGLESMVEVEGRRRGPREINWLDIL